MRYLFRLAAIAAPFIAGVSFLTAGPASASAADHQEWYACPDCPSVSEGVPDTHSVVLLVSNNGAYNLRLQSDGNLVLTHAGVGAIWSSRTNGKHAQKLIYQYDNNIVIYNTDGNPIWATNTSSGQTHYDALILQNDGNLVLYEDSWAKWATGTNGR
jgi:hypothetical protein